MSVRFRPSVILFFFLLISSVNTLSSEAKTHKKKQKDFYSREYFERWDGKIEFPIEQDYFSVIPTKKDFRIYAEEVPALMEKKRFLEACFLSSSSLLCLEKDISKKEIWGERFQKNLNLIFSIHHDRLEEFKKFSDPRICKDENSIYVDSKEYSYSLEIPSEFEYKFPKDSKRNFEDSRSHKIRSLYFYQKQNPSSNQNTDLEEELKKITSEELYNTHSKLILSIHSTVHKLDIPNLESMIEFWERKRGMNELWKKNYNFSREKISEGFLTKFNILEKNGIVKQYYVYEKYLILSKREVSIFFSFPSEMETKANSYWKKIISSIKTF
ncbi:MAG: hypothetical protein SFU98_13490 [Leptospiraceae bacterium]|nr:hypothetical protein [Leptospiraceae bacterium]